MADVTTDEVIEEEEVPLGVEDEAVEEIVEDNDVPLGSGGEETEGELIRRKKHWSIIPLIVAAVTGKTYYDKKNKKGIFAEKDTAAKK